VVRDVINDLSALVFQKEPVACESSIDDPTSETLIADLRVRGVWEPQVDAIFDVHVVDTDAPSYADCSPQTVIQTAIVQKKGKYIPLLVRHIVLVLPHLFLVLMVCLVRMLS